MIGLDYLSLPQISEAVTNFPILIPPGKQGMPGIPVKDTIANVFFTFFSFSISSKQTLSWLPTTFQYFGGHQS